MRRWMILFGVVLLVAGLGGSAAGQSAVSIFDLPHGVAQLGAGGTGISVISGAETLYYNPASLSGLSGINFSSLFASHLGQGSYSAFALTMQSVGLGIEMVNAGSIQGYDDAGNPTGDMSFGNTAISLGFGVNSSQLPFLRILPVDLAIGGQLKFVTATLDTEKGSGFSFDLAARVVFPDIAMGSLALTGPAIGVTAANLFGSLSYGDRQESFPMDLGLGASAGFLGVARVAVDVHTSGSFGVGVTYSPMPTLALRLGVLDKGAFSITAGVGLSVQGFLIDYAFVSNSLGGSHRIGLTLDFSALDLSAFGSMLRRILP